MCERPKNYNFDSRGNERPHPAGHYLIPRDQLPTVLVRMQWDKSVLRCFPFVPRQAPGPCPCPPAPSLRRR
jgi:hypothetical protein